MEAGIRQIEGKVVTVLLLSKIAIRPVSINPWVIVVLSDLEHSLTQGLIVKRRGPRPDQISLTIRRGEFSGNEKFPIPVRLQLEYRNPSEMVVDVISHWSEEGLRCFLERTREQDCFVIGFGFITQDKLGRLAYSVCPNGVVMGRVEDIHDQEGNQSA